MELFEINFHFPCLINKNVTIYIIFSRFWFAMNKMLVKKKCLALGYWHPFDKQMNFFCFVNCIPLVSFCLLKNFKLSTVILWFFLYIFVFHFPWRSTFHQKWKAKTFHRKIFKPQKMIFHNPKITHL